MRVCFVPVGLDGQGCYRCIFPATYLSAVGVGGLVPQFTVSDGSGRQVPPLPLPGLLAVPPGFLNVGFRWPLPDADVYVFQMGLMEFMVDWARQLKAAGKRIVLDLDDDVHRIPKYNPGRIDAHAVRDTNRKHTQRLCQLADAVTVATPELARFYGRWNRNVHLLPNYLDWSMWEPLRPVYERREWRRFRVGYMGIADFHGADLETVAGPVGRWVREHPDVEFVAAGDPRIHDIFGIPEGQRVSTSKVWFRNLDLPYITSTFDVGLVPLVRNDFNEAKSYLKGLEYSACGIVPVCTPTEQYRGFVRDGVDGFLARQPSGFASCLDVLYGDGALRRSMGGAARQKAREYSLDRHIQEWADVYESVCADSDRPRAGVAA